MKIPKIFFFLILAAVFQCSTREKVSKSDSDQRVRINQIQVIGSHNSYKRAIDPSLMQILREDDPETAQALDYQHILLREQLNLGLRKLELDIFYDPEGGRYAQPGGIQTVREKGLPPGPDYDPESRMGQPGFKVLHVQDIDFRTNYFLLSEALNEIRGWSRTNSGHLPIVITFNAKDGIIEDHPEFVEPLPFDEKAFDALDEEILEIFNRSEIILPDDVRGDYASLEAAVLDKNWPTLDEARGKVMFVLDEKNEKQTVYIKNHPSLEGRVMFVNAREGKPEAAFRIINDPLEDGQYIRRLVLAGYLVRTRADADTMEARTGETRRRDSAFESGAHFISTDYYVPNPEFGTGYRVQFPNEKYFRWNPVTMPETPDINLENNR